MTYYAQLLGGMQLGDCIRATGTSFVSILEASERSCRWVARILSESSLHLVANQDVCRYVIMRGGMHTAYELTPLIPVVAGMRKRISLRPVYAEGL